MNTTEKTAVIKAYDSDSADAAFSILFASGIDGEDGLKEIPAASLQLVVSALEYILWDVRDRKDREALNRTIGTVEMLRDKQKMREYGRRYGK